jgi:hypothetical protein
MVFFSLIGCSRFSGGPQAASLKPRRLAPPWWAAAILRKPSLHAGLLVFAAMIGWSLSPQAAQAKPKAYAVCFLSNHTDPPCPSSYHLGGIIIIDTLKLDTVSSFTAKYDYDPTQLRFRADTSSLLCDLRSSSAPTYCPTFAPGAGTTPLEAFPDQFVVDQTGLTITPDPSGLSSVTLSYAAPAGVSISGERNFLALAFDLVPHYDKGVTVTYSPTPQLDASLATGPIQCADASGLPLDCALNNPSSFLKVDPVPAPLAVGGLPVMLHASRRLRRRIQLTASR